GGGDGRSAGAGSSGATGDAVCLASSPSRGGGDSASVADARGEGDPAENGFRGRFGSVVASRDAPPGDQGVDRRGVDDAPAAHVVDGSVDRTVTFQSRTARLLTFARLTDVHRDDPAVPAQTRITSAPASAIANAISRPRPRLPPVMNVASLEYQTE